MILIFLAVVLVLVLVVAQRGVIDSNLLLTLLIAGVLVWLLLTYAGHPVT